jgi:hypothetical protein
MKYRIKLVDCKGNYSTVHADTGTVTFLLQVIRLIADVPLFADRHIKHQNIKPNVP